MSMGLGHQPTDWSHHQGAQRLQPLVCLSTLLCQHRHQLRRGQAVAGAQGVLRRRVAGNATVATGNGVAENNGKNTWKTSENTENTWKMMGK